MVAAAVVGAVAVAVVAALVVPVLVVAVLLVAVLVVAVLLVAVLVVAVLVVAVLVSSSRSRRSSSERSSWDRLRAARSRSFSLSPSSSSPSRRCRRPGPSSSPGRRTSRPARCPGSRRRVSLTVRSVERLLPLSDPRSDRSSDVASSAECRPVAGGCASAARTSPSTGSLGASFAGRGVGSRNRGTAGGAAGLEFATTGCAAVGASGWRSRCSRGRGRGRGGGHGCGRDGRLGLRRGRRRGGLRLRRHRHRDHRAAQQRTTDRQPARGGRQGRPGAALATQEVGHRPLRRGHTATVRCHVTSLECPFR